MSGSFDFKFSTVMKESEALDKLREAMKVLRENEVYVGVPQEENKDNDPENPGVTNAELLYIHTYGSPLKGIPAREVLEPAILNGKDNLQEIMKKIAETAAKGNADATLRQLELLGQQASNEARAWFTNPANGWAPNHPATIKYKKSSRPLIDHGELRKSITHVVDKKGARK